MLKPYLEGIDEAMEYMSAPQAAENGVFQKGEYRYFVKKTEYRVHLNLGICG